MQSPPCERRIRPRSRIQFPIVLFADGSADEAPGITRDISQTGVFFYTEYPLALGQVIDFKVLLPVPGRGSTRAMCRGTVVRVETSMMPATSDRGVAVAITKLKMA